MLKKIFCIFIFCVSILLFSSCKGDTLQEECDRQSTIECFLEDYKPIENGLGINYRFNFDYDSKIFKDKDYLIYQTIKDVEYHQYNLSHKDDHIPKEDISLIYGSCNSRERNFILLNDLERVCVYRIFDGHIEFHYSYRYYRINKADGLKIMEVLEKLEIDKNEAN